MSLAFGAATLPGRPARRLTVHGAARLDAMHPSKSIWIKHLPGAAKADSL